MTDKIERSATRVRGFANHELDFQLLRQLGSGVYGGSSPGECFHVASRMPDESAAAWVQAFTRLAERQADDAAARQARGHAVSARDLFLKAASSYRAAEYYTFVEEPEHRRLGLASREAFLRAMELMEHGFEALRIPFEDMTLPAYFMTPTTGSAPRKTKIIISGFDGTLEESYFQGGRAALERGYNLLLLAGPGQMDTLRFHPDKRFRPDFDKPVSAALDWLWARPEVDRGRVALQGISFGGHFCLRAACEEPRLAALIPNAAILDLHAYLVSMAGTDFAEIPDAEDATDEMIVAAPDLPSAQKEMARALIARFGQRSLKSTFRYLKEFRVTEQDLARIRCPSLALVGSGEGAAAMRDSDLFVRSVGGASSCRVFTEEEGADSHCQVGNMALSAAVVYDWLDETLA
jgi:hypothetical protein